MPQPLCPALYRRMEELFGHVEIVHEGEEAVPGQVMTVMGRDRVYGGSNGEYYVVNCPFCGDTSGRLNVNYQFMEPKHRHKAVCYNETACLTGEAGKVNRRKLFEAFSSGAPLAFSYRPATSVKLTLPDAPPPLPGVVLPLHAVSPGHPAVRYLVEQRKLDPIQLDREYGVGVVMSASPMYWKTQGRVYVPITMHGKLVGWQTRYPGELDWKKEGITKYYNLPDMHKSLMLYGYDAAVNARADFVILVEGVTDVWGCGPPAVSILGGSISDAQIGLILSRWRHVILYLDGDAVMVKGARVGKPEGAKTMLERAYDKLLPALSAVGGSLTVVSLPSDLDPGKLSRKDNWDWIISSFQKTQRGGAV